LGWASWCYIAGGCIGLLTGTGMNDRQYLLERNIQPLEMVSNSAMAAMKTAGHSINPISPPYEPSIWCTNWCVAQANYENRVDGQLQRKNT